MLTETQIAILRKLRDGAKLYGRVDDPHFVLIWGTLPDEEVATRDALALFREGLISPWFPSPEITPLGLEALTAHEEEA